YSLFQLPSVSSGVSPSEAPNPPRSSGGEPLDGDEPAEHAAALPALRVEALALDRERAAEARRDVRVVRPELGRFERASQISVERRFVQMAGHEEPPSLVHSMVPGDHVRTVSAPYELSKFAEKTA